MLKIVKSQNAGNKEIQKQLLEIKKKVSKAYEGFPNLVESDKINKKKFDLIIDDLIKNDSTNYKIKKYLDNINIFISEDGGFFNIIYYTNIYYQKITIPEEILEPAINALINCEIEYTRFVKIFNIICQNKIEDVLVSLAYDSIKLLHTLETIISDYIMAERPIGEIIEFLNIIQTEAEFVIPEKLDIDFIYNYLLEQMSGIEELRPIFFSDKDLECFEYLNKLKYLPLSKKELFCQQWKTLLLEKRHIIDFINSSIKMIEMYYCDLENNNIYYVDFKGAKKK